MHAIRGTTVAGCTRFREKNGVKQGGMNQEGMSQGGMKQLDLTRG